MVYQRPYLERLSGVERLLQCIQNKVGFGRVGHPPTDDPSSEYIDHESHIGKSLPGRHVREVGHPQFVGPICPELPVDPIQWTRHRPITDCCTNWLASYGAAQAQTAHEPLDRAARHVEALVVTRGGEGSNIYTGGTRIDIPCAKPAQLRDPTGCGDAYRAGLLYGLMNGLDWATTGRIASLIGAIKIEHAGTQNHRLDRKSTRLNSSHRT